MMRAVWYEAKGKPADVLRVGERPKPVAAPGEVLVKVFASAVNPSDTKARSGTGGAAPPFPAVIPHQDGAGVIEAVGEGVDAARIGERVWFYQAQWQRPFGSAAQWVALPALRAIRLSDRASFAEGACLGIPAMTAHRAVHTLGGVAGKRVLVQGGVGVVGRYAIQFAQAAGASVVAATVSSAVRREAAASAGAGIVFDKGAGPLAGAVERHAGSVEAFDRIVEVNLGANIDEDIAVLAPHGQIVSYSSDADWTPALPVRPLMAKNIVLSPILVYTMGQAAIDAAVADITALTEAGRLTHRISHVLPLEQAALAHEMQESGRADGKLILAPWTVQEARA